MPKRKPAHSKVLKMEAQKERARLAMRVMKVRMCIEYRMTKTEITDHTGLSEKSINRVLAEHEDLAQLHTFSLLERTHLDDRRIQNLKRFL